MGNLWDDCLSGTLKDSDLQKYLQVDGTLINAPNPVTPFLTPLAAACSRGRLDVVVLLINNPWSRPDVNKPSLRGRTPLHYTLLDSPPANRAAIVRVLLDQGAKLEATDDQGNTPLILAVGARDANAVKLLVERGASKAASNNKGATPLSLAKGTPMEAALNSSGLGASIRTLATAVINAILSAVLLIISYVNKNLLRRGDDANPTGPGGGAGSSSGNIPSVVGNTVKDLYGISGTKEPLPDPEVAKELPLTDPKTPAEFNRMIDSWIEESELKSFFPAGDRFLQTLAEKAAALRADQNDALSSKDNIRRLTQLSLYYPIIYCDDSASMRQGSRYDVQKDLVNRIARIATRIVPDDIGVEVRFINADFDKTNLSLQEVSQALTDNGPTGPATKIGSALQDKILKPFVYSYLPTQTLKRPILVCVITDGSPTAEPQDTFKNAIVECRRMVADAEYPPDAVRFLVSQIGDDAAAKIFLQTLNEDRDINDIVHCTTDRLDAEFVKMRQNEDQLESWLLGVLVSPIMNRE